MEIKIPAVSVIIPMYNAEKYIGECLDSILSQTFSDYEVITVNDFSTDDTCKVVESYTEKFNGKLQLVSTKKNFGNPGVPRNIGLNISRGKYIYFVDNDDLLKSNALETLFNFAEEYAADVVCMHRHFILSGESQKVTPRLFDEPFIESENIADRIKHYNKGRLRLIPWLNFSRRNFLIENAVYFPKIKLGEDDFWFLKLMTRAKKILCIPNALYVNRNNPNSITRHKKNVDEQINLYMTPSITGMKLLKEIFDETEFFQQNPKYWYICVSRIFNYDFRAIFDCCKNLSPYEVYEIFNKQFAQVTGEHCELISYLCSQINAQQKMLTKANARIAELEKIQRK